MATITAVKPNNPVKARAYFEDKMTYTTGPVELNRMLEQRQDIVIVDVREAEDYNKGHIPGAINLPQERWESCQGIKKDKQNIFYCYSHVCHLATKAALQFAEQGYPAMELEGGWKAWSQHALPVQR